MNQISKKQRIAIIILLILLVITIIANYVVISKYRQWKSEETVTQYELLEQSAEYQQYLDDK